MKLVTKSIAAEINGNTTQTKLTFKDGCEIELLFNGNAVINDSDQILTVTDLDKPHFKSETGEDVVEYSGIGVDGNLTRSWAKATFELRGFSPTHFHKVMTEDYYIISEDAQARVIVDGKVHDLSTGDHIQILPHQVHEVLNLSKEKDLSLFVKCTPSWSLQDHHLCSRPHIQKEPV